MTGKIVVCRCEDVTLEEVESSIERGHGDIEGIKRYTGFGTGPCQGKECLAVMARVLVEHFGQPAAAVEPFTSRQPIAPTPLSHLAGLSMDEDSEAEGGS